ncbi:zinc-dependent alcohol dehydrogenase [Mycolicibacterium holsaticum]|uniref:zinc-dependent alcohol dehydrogenase n=1 Tax=Mycolicibacterium holsaticum TaxID=152142 RepID=UPI001C7D17E0|nr:zinc-dependent alcohol dehydrogenase [Mycolicibacterium holsaticum]MDA4108362.1 molecular chaperone GroES [Mycolicibacterium holsaticum DSM 44478 = JCM 12374]QZA12877.1 glutathione-dependent formaldehyde dehydrogenase [Mycolicibacterium holsaticum DSM 44478 = JCM 12374]UNC09649.1 glutathione-dependent formaldehyde dehydrogenase [Mycolicibacterium holsaticum DSM 44478 = JCM 12374]
MRAVTWQGRRKVSVDTVPDPAIKEPNDAIIRVTSTNICGSDLHLYEVLGAFMGEGDILGHEAMGVVEEVGRDVNELKVGDRVVIPFNISCGHCFMCDQGLQSQCETTQNRDQGTGAALFGYSKLYGEVAGGQAEYLRVPQAQYTHIKVPADGPDERYVYLSDVLPTAWQGVEYADVPDGGTLVVLGLGPIGSMACRIASHRNNCKVIGVDLVNERLDRARDYCEEIIDLRKDDAAEIVKSHTQGRGADSVIDAVGMEAHGSPIAEAAQTASGFLPSPVGRVMMKHAGVDRLAALNSAISLVRRGGTISVSGVYGGAADPINMMTLFDKQIQLRMGQANVKRWVPDIMPLLTADDPLGVEQFATHRLPLAAAPDAYASFQKKQDGMVKVVLTP